MLAEPNVDDPLIPEAAHEWRHNRALLMQKVMHWSTYGLCATDSQPSLEQQAQGRAWLPKELLRAHGELAAIGH